MKIDTESVPTAKKSDPDTPYFSSILTTLLIIQFRIVTKAYGHQNLSNAEKAY